MKTSSVTGNAGQVYMCYQYYASLRLYLMVFYYLLLQMPRPAADDAEANVPQKKDAASHALLLETATGNYDAHDQSIQTAREV